MKLRELLSLQMPVAVEREFSWVFDSLTLTDGKFKGAHNKHTSITKEEYDRYSAFELAHSHHHFMVLRLNDLKDPSLRNKINYVTTVRDLKLRYLNTLTPLQRVFVEKATLK